jgi:glycosyltransferase involved in cell wall biosynthesis
LSRKQIVYTGGFRFPEGDAAAARVLGIGKALRDLGYTVTFAGAEAAGRSSDLNEDGEFWYQGFKYASQDELRSSELGRWARLTRYLRMGHKTAAWLKTQPPGSTQAVFLYNGMSGYQWRLASFCARNHLPLICDITEWYEPTHWSGGRFDPRGWDVEATLRYWVPRAQGAIVISRYLEQVFVRHGRPVLRVPPLVDLQEPKWEFPTAGTKGTEELRVVYAGDAGRKDLLANAIRGLSYLGERGKSVRMFIVGPSHDEFASSLGSDSELLNTCRDQVEFTGRLPHRVALQRVAECDFSIMLRPHQRFAEAGFPTKLVESLACGVPMIGNLTSDIGMYVRDGIEGIVLADCTPESFAQGLERALSLSPDQRQAMREAARRRAEGSFDYRNWVETIGQFMDAVLGK